MPKLKLLVDEKLKTSFTIVAPLGSSPERVAEQIAEYSAFFGGTGRTKPVDLTLRTPENPAKYIPSNKVVGGIEVRLICKNTRFGDVYRVEGTDPQGIKDFRQYLEQAGFKD